MSQGCERILGIDPGTRSTGIAVIETNGNTETALHYCTTHGTSKLTEQRLFSIFNSICNIIEKYTPTVAAIETVFVHKNVAGALKLGQARGAALIACGKYNLQVNEYNPRQIKQSITGHGAANKNAMQLFIRNHFNMTTTPQADAADALAIALTHRFHAKWNKRIKDTVEQK